MVDEVQQKNNSLKENLSSTIKYNFFFIICKFAHVMKFKIINLY